MLATVFVKSQTVARLMLPDNCAENIVNSIKNHEIDPVAPYKKMDLERSENIVTFLSSF